MYTFLILATLAGLSLTLVTAPLGAFVVWRRMAYFGDTLAHAGLLGVALGFLFQFTYPMVAVVCVCCVIAGLLLILEAQPQLASDSVLGILSHAALALGVIVAATIPTFRGDLFGYLFGDILAVGLSELITLSLVVLAVLGVLCWQWQSLLATTIDEELAAVEGVPVRRVKALFVLMLAVVIAVSMKLLGVLLITAMLIIPPVTARPFCKTPEQMVGLSVLLSMFAVVAGLASSWFLDLPASPAIVVVATILFGFSQVLIQKR